MSLLEAKNISVVNGPRRLCQGLDLNVEPGQRWGLLGKNGIGKTSLLQTLAGLRKPETGNVFVEDCDLTNWNKRALATKVGVLFQDSFDTFPVTVMETVLCGRHPHLPFWAFEAQQDFELAMQALTDVGLEDAAYRQVISLSGGERRRLAVATLLLQKPRLWLLDEPTNHLDLSYQIAILELIVKKHQEDDGACIMVLHDVNLVSRFCTHVGFMIDAENVLTGKVEDIINEKNLYKLYDYPVKKIMVDNKQYYYPD
jgi:iron complex transport system ATP-binding protein